jgi:hypothetical protein
MVIRLLISPEVEESIFLQNTANGYQTARCHAPEDSNPFPKIGYRIW